MNGEWLDNVVCTKKQKNAILEWCKFIGFERYEQLYTILSGKLEKVEYKQLKALAQYDLRLSDFLHSMIKLVELRLRALITEDYGNLSLTFDNYLYEITRVLGENKRYLSKKTYFNENNKLTLSEYVNGSTMDTLLKIVDVLSDEKLLLLSNDVSEIKNELKLIKNIRNEVAHSRVLLGADSSSLSKSIQIILKYLPTNKTRQKRIKELNTINRKFLISSNMNTDIAMKLIVTI